MTLKGFPVNRSKCVWMAIVAVSLFGAGCVSVPAVRIERGAAVVESPFDLEVGSTEYAKVLQNRLHSTSSARYDLETKTATTNWSWYATARLTQPYHGMRELHLRFADEDRHLASFELSRGLGRESLTMDACRAEIEAIAAELTARFGCTMKSDSEASAEKIDKWIAEMSQPHTKAHEMRPAARSFLIKSGERRLPDGHEIRYVVTGMMNGKRLCSLGLSVQMQHDPKKIARAVDATRGLVSDEARARAHAEAAKFRAMMKTVFGVDFDGSESSGNAVKDDWKVTDTPFAGLNERRAWHSARLFGIPLSTFALRRTYDGPVDEAEQAAVATEVRAQLEKAYGEKIPEMDAEEAKRRMAPVLGEGVPAYGDSRGMFQLDRTYHFLGRVGDVVVEISSALPQFARTGEKYEVVVKGGVMLFVVQSSIVAWDGEKK